MIPRIFEHHDFQQNSNEIDVIFVVCPRENLGHTQTDFNETWSDQSLLTDLKDLRRWSAEDLIDP